MSDELIIVKKIRGFHYCTPFNQNKGEKKNPGVNE
jgi:hypothetical protein